jgi:hypothetical protein
MRVIGWFRLKFTYHASVSCPGRTSTHIRQRISFVQPTEGRYDAKMKTFIPYIGYTRSDFLEHQTNYLQTGGSGESLLDS